MSTLNRRGFLQGAAAIAALAACEAPKRACDPEGNGDCARPRPGLPDGVYFAQLAADLEAADLGTPQILIDLDALDSNADAIAGGISADRYRIVEKSLPSLDLLGYVHGRTGVDRFMVMHLPFLPGILRAFPTAAVLIGKPQPIGAVRRLFRAFTAAELQSVAARVHFLVDSRARAEELVALSSELGVVLNAAAEIDIGLHRGGIRYPSKLGDVLSVFDEARLRFTGMMGYDGHVTNAPALPGLEESAARATWKTAMTFYDAFIAVLRNEFPALWRDDLIFNSGGTSTYSLYTSGPVNDVSAGGGMLRPGTYASMFIPALKPAIFLAAPVLTHSDTVELPFVKTIGEAIYDGMQGFTMYGGGWPGEIVWPKGVESAPFVSGEHNENLVPNQSWMIAPGSPRIGPGDWIFHYPKEADAIFQFEDILLVRGGRLQTDTWRAFPRRY